jgi:hypothetical protein
MAESSNWRDYVAKISAPWMLRTWGERFFGLLGLITDTASEGVKLALLSNWLLEPTSPDDILPKIGRERHLHRYPAETPAQHRTRLHQAWATWVNAGSHVNMITQFELAGWPGVMIFDNAEIYEWESPHDTENISRFWVIMPPESHTFAADGIWSDPGTWTDGGLWDTSNATFEQIQTMRGIIRKFKPVDWRCAGIIAVLTWDNPTLGSADDFSAVEWTEGADATVTANAIAGPEAASFADEVASSSGSPSANVYVTQTPGNIDSGRPTYFIVDAKAGTEPFIAYSDGDTGQVWFDLANGVVASETSVILKTSMTDLGDGWWRCLVVTDADPALARWHVASADQSLLCDAVGTAYLYQADIYNYKFGSSIFFGAS